MARLELPVVRAHGELLPDWLLPSDLPWLRPLCDALEVLAGVPRREAAARLQRLGRDPRAGARGGFAAAVIAAALPTEVVAAAEPAALRQRLAAAMRTASSPAVAERLVAAELQLSPAQLQAALLADVAPERAVRAMEPQSPHQWRLCCNGELARRLLLPAQAAELRLCGHARAVVRQLRLSGIDCEVSGRDAGGDLRLLPVPPPHSQQRRLGRALAALLTTLPWCRRFRLRARVPVGDGSALLVLGSGDPLPAGPEPRQFDSAVERAFARDFAALRSAWQLWREPEPVAVAGTLQFPDFALQHEDGRRVLLEIAGWWRPGYLQRKLQLLQARGVRLLLCVDSGSQQVELPASVLRFRRRLDAGAVLQRLSAPWPD